jgi:hypothetical protein
MGPLLSAATAAGSGSAGALAIGLDILFWGFSLLGPLCSFCPKMAGFCARGDAVSGGGMLLDSVALGMVERLAAHGRRKVGGSWPRLSNTARLSVREIMLAIVFVWYMMCTLPLAMAVSCLRLGEWNLAGSPEVLLARACLATRP